MEEMTVKAGYGNISRRSAMLSGLLAGVGVLSAASRSIGQGRKKVKFAGTNLIGVAPMYLAAQLGYFADEGIDAEILESPSGNASVSSLVGGSVDVAATGYIIPFQLAEKGLKVRTLVGLMMKSFYVFVVRPELDVRADDPLTLVKALKGKRFGVSNLGSAGDTIASGVLSDFGGKPGDFVKVAVGVGSTALAALKSGAVDGLITYEPDLSQIVKAGVGKIALDLRSTQAEHSFSRLPSMALQATGMWIEKNPDVAAGVVRAVARANTTMREDPGTSLEALAKLYPSVDAADVKSMYEGEKGGFLSAVPKEDFEFSQQMYLKMKAISRTYPYEEMTATRFAALWK
jgi:NitT/TauT family transport system substrate-binding protein